MVPEQKSITAQEALIGFGARFNAEAVRLGDNIHDVLTRMDATIREQQQKIADLETAIAKTTVLPDEKCE